MNAYDPKDIPLPVSLGLERLSGKPARQDKRGRQVKDYPLTKHLVARRFWRPLARTVSFVQRPFLQSYDWLFTKRKLEHACFKMFTPTIRLHSWLARKGGQQRPVQLYHPSSLAYDLAAIGAALLAPLARWESACRDRMNQETDPRLRHDSSRN